MAYKETLMLNSLIFNVKLADNLPGSTPEKIWGLYTIYIDHGDVGFLLNLANHQEKTCKLQD